MTDAADLNWRTSSYSNGGGACVEVADLPDGTSLVRDTKDQGRGHVLRFTASEWQAFLTATKNGVFD